ncbi:MAG: exodeoxyribonuclease III [Saccharospirillaceae bacterium]|nr:exodeoxyribonuclease III [Pseudomonadales bacterium]NRB79058.1 exodeoxyribonuclease III [Saccharospirillaceae bacterium]
MKIVSFNCNGIRARLHQLTAMGDKTGEHQNDIVCLQEIKVHDSQFPMQDILDCGFSAIKHHGQKGYHGVATLSKTSILESQHGYAHDDEDSQKRFIMTKHKLPNDETLTIVNGYFPQGDNIKNETKFPAKQKFYEDLMDWLNEQNKDDHIVVLGDFNISPEDCDIGIGAVNAKRWLKSGKCSFQPIERQWYQRLLGWGFKDSYRILRPEDNSEFSWFDYRSKGFDDTPKRGLRIDGVLISVSLEPYLKEVGIDYDIRGMEKPSDHAPIWARFEF